jgi:hypothetical protein
MTRECGLLRAVRINRFTSCCRSRYINSSRNGSVIYYELFFKEKMRLWVIMAILSIVLDARNIMLELRPSLEHPGNFHYEDKCWVISQIHIDVCFAF